MGDIFGWPVIILRRYAVRGAPRQSHNFATQKIPGVERISEHIVGVPVAQLGGYRQPHIRATVRNDTSQDGTNISIPANYIPYFNTEVPDDISMLTNPLMAKFPKAETQSLISHSNLKYEDIRVVNNEDLLD